MAISERIRRSRSSEFSMNSDGEDIQRSAITVECWIDDVLVVTGNPECFTNVHTVKQIQCGFGSRRDRAVADESIDAPKAQVSHMRRGNPAQVHSNACIVEGTRPVRAFCQASE